MQPTVPSNHRLNGRIIKTQTQRERLQSELKTSCENIFNHDYRTGGFALIHVDDNMPSKCIYSSCWLLLVANVDVDLYKNFIMYQLEIDRRFQVKQNEKTKVEGATEMCTHIFSYVLVFIRFCINLCVECLPFFFVCLHSNSLLSV